MAKFKIEMVAGLKWDEERKEVKREWWVAHEPVHERGREKWTRCVG